MQGPRTGTRRGNPGLAAGLAAVLSIGLAVRLPHLDAPLLEGAAGKQTHTAMVARNLYRGRSTWIRPMVDDVGRPGYFVKEAPVMPGMIALAYRAAGGVHEWMGRLLGAFAWLLAVPILIGILRPDIGAFASILAALWFVISPLGIVYSRAFQNDSLAVAVSLGGLALALAWRRRPGAGRVAGTSALVALALLLKPHSIFWLGPGLLVVLLGAAPARDEPPGRAATVKLILGLGLGALLPAAWYAHAAAVHRAYPVPGATIASGWVDPSLWSQLHLYAIIARQELTMVFTPVGALIALAALLPARRSIGLAPRALLAWGGGVLLQCVILGTRMFDERARGTEYYQLAAVPVAAMLIATGLRRIGRSIERPLVRTAITAGLLAALCLASAAATRPVLQTPVAYRTLIADCEAVRALTSPDDEILVLADRGGTVLYYCDRRGLTLAPADTLDDTGRRSGTLAERDDLAQMLTRARFLYLPVPDLIARPAGLDTWLERDWQRVPMENRRAELWVRRDAGGLAPGRKPGARLPGGAMPDSGNER